MNRDRPVLHGDDHTPGGPDPIRTGVRHLVGETGEPAFQNSWTNEGGDAEDLQFWLTAGSYRAGLTLADKRASLEIIGSVTGGTYGTVVFTLPDGYRPAGTLYLPGRDADMNEVTWVVESTGDVSVYAATVADGSITGSKLENSGVTAGTYGDATHVAQVTVDAKGRVTAAADVAITGSGGDVATDSTWDAKGDLAVGTGADTAAKLTVGSDDTALIADSAQTSGVKWAQVGEAMIALTDVTTLDVSTTKHGFAPKAPNDATKYLDGTGAWSVPAGAVIGASPGSDTTANGLRSDLTAGETLAFGDPVYVKSDGKAWKADADTAGAYPAVGIAITAAAANATVTVLLHGFARDDAWVWTVGGLVYLSTGSGLTQVQPSATDNAIQVIGVATAATRIYVNPQLVYLTHA